MPLPTELHMPALSNLGKNLCTVILNIAFARGGPRDDLLRRNFVNFIRLVDLSVAQYETARSYLEASLPDAENRLGSLLSAVDHLEFCIITVRRALNALQSVKGHPESPDIPRLERRALHSFNDELRPTRNAIIHIEKYISSGKVSSGESHALLVSEDGRTASIGGHHLSLENLGKAICRLHGLADVLSQHREDDETQ
jgi:hypothetical protein